MPRILFFLFAVLFSLSGSAQKAGFSGKVMDTVNIRPIVYATVSAIRKQDSVLVKYTRTNQQGRFNLEVPDTGTFILLIAHSQFIDFVDEVHLTSSGNKDLGEYALIQRGQQLREVIIKNLAGVKVKGDTLEYLADSFKVRQGAMVEDLLRVLPGIQVNKKGEITAMGEKVEKVLVDGEEFFGDDPTVATQNIQSKVVDKVQVFDKKSEQAAFTGFDDGQEQKTINLKLKDNMNRGEFGKIEAGTNFDQRWQNQAMVNSFKNKRQMSLYGLMSSNGKTGLGWEDRNKYTGENAGMQMDEDGGFMWTFYDNDDDGPQWGNNIPEGITKAWTGGAHYANKWKDQRHHLNTNYSFGRINRTRQENSITENLLPGRSFETMDTSRQFSSRNTHRVSGRYEFMVDSSLTIIYNLTARLAFIEGESYSSAYNQSYDEQPISSRSTLRKDNSVTGRANNQLTLNKKFKKTGRTLSLMGSFNYNKNSGDGTIDGTNRYVISGTTLNEVLDQQKEDELQAGVLNAEATFTEPLSKKVLMKLSYGFTSDNNHSRKSTYVWDTARQDYTFRVDSLSSEFESTINSHTGGLEFKYNEKKYNITMGSKIRYSLFDQQDLVRSRLYDYNRINLFPTLRFNYKFDQFRRFTFSYNGSTRQPSINQIQPVQDNSNPLNIYIGNPNLKIAYNQNFNINYFSYKVMSSRSLYAGIYFSNSFNNIATNRTFDELGRNINTFVNLKGGYNASMWAGIQAKIPKTAIDGKLNLNGSFAHTPNIINNVEGSANTISMTFTPGLSYSKEEFIYLNLDLGAIYTQTRNQLQTNRDIRFFSFNPSASFNLYLPHNFEIGSDVDYLYNPPVGPYANAFDRFLWNAYASYKMLKGKNLEWRFSVNDILNQNTGYERSTTANFNTERYFLTLRRFWMVGLVWNFNHGPMANANAGSNAPRGPRMGGPRRGGGRRIHR